MKLLSPFISKLARLRFGRVSNWISYPYSVQRNVLQHLILHAQGTEFGRKYEFKKILTVKDFKVRVPIHLYDDLKPYIQRMMNGEEKVLWDTPINWFAKSSGTTSGKSKFIPLSEESFKNMHYKASKDVLTNYYNNFPDSDLLTGKGLVVGGSHRVNALNEDIQYGDLSALLMQNSPFWGQWLRTPELKIALMDEWETKIEELARKTIQENVTSIAGVPTWTIILIKRILELTGKSTLIEVWPNLELYLHGGVCFTPYRDQMDRLIGKPINYLEMYNASEGFFAAQYMPDDEGMLLFTDHGIFYEFLPVEELGNPDAQTIGLREVQLGKNYALVISTNGGLWRYLVGDTVVFTSLHPFKIKVTGRTKYFINAFGEEVIAENAETAISKAANATNASVLDYTASPIYFSDSQNGAHEWLVEFENPPADIHKFTEVLDKTLKEVNSDYEAKRYKEIALRLPVVKIVPKGTFQRWLKSKGKLGGQHKVPRLSNDRQLVDEILHMMALH